jgi:ligand-binding sensor domain-containing protein
LTEPTTTSSKSSGGTFWLTILAIALVFYFINESKNAGTSEQSQSISQEQSDTTAAIATDIAPRKFGDAQGPSAALQIPFSRPIKTAAVNDLLVDPSGTVWAATEAGITSIQNDQVTNYSLAMGTFPFVQAQCLAHDGRQLWAGTLFGLCVMTENKRFISADVSSSLPSQMIWDLTVDGATLWAGTQNGAAFLDKTGTFITIDEHTTNSGLRHNWCKRIFRMDSWFVAAHDSGLSLWNTSFPAANPEWWKNIDHARAGLIRPVTGIAYDGKFLWISTPRGVMHLTTPVNRFFSDFVPNLVSYSRIHGLPADRINSIIHHKGALWIATNEGLARIKNDTIQLISPESGNFARKIRALASSGDLLWLGTDEAVQFINTAMVD